ncbi:MAG: hypothetical protein IPO25_23295 [Saprospiraceae bacterium]|nr:hypothetical protein [Saprospiraceae bacterium]
MVKLIKKLLVATYKTLTLTVIDITAGALYLHTEMASSKFVEICPGHCINMISVLEMSSLSNLPLLNEAELIGEKYTCLSR